MKRQPLSIIPKVRIFLSTVNGEGAFGPGKGDLIAAIEKYGSINKAAAALERSYRQVWGEINIAEKHLGFLLVTRSRGGAQGGKTALTVNGKLFLRAWKKYCDHLSAELETSFRKYISPVISRSKGGEHDRKGTTGC